MSEVDREPPARAMPYGRATPETTRTERARRTEALLQASLGAGDVERRRMLDEVVVLNMPVANALAARYRSRGIATEDLRQAAYLALVKAAHGFDPSAGYSFLSYGVPTMTGEIKRYFRDHGWVVRPPRRVQELQARITTAEAEMFAQLGRSPRPSELARHLDEPLDAVTEALACDGCFTPASLDRPVDEAGTATLGDLLGSEDAHQGAAEARTTLAPAVRGLQERDRRILMLRYFRGLTQQEIADDIGVTQMQVSRLLKRIRCDLRRQLEDAEASTC